MITPPTLRKAFKKAAKNGFDLSRYMVAYRGPEKEKEWELWGHYSVKDIIYDHDFAKALWGEDVLIRGLKEIGTDSSKYYLPNWQHHLQQMVISEDPIEYLSKNI